MVRVVAYERQVVPALACPLIQPPLHVLCSANFEKYGFLVGVLYVRSEGVDHV